VLAADCFASCGRWLRLAQVIKENRRTWDGDCRHGRRGLDFPAYSPRRADLPDTRHPPEKRVDACRADEIAPEPMGQITRITVHHEGSNAPPVYARSAVAERLRNTRKQHMKSASHGGLGAGEIGYHFMIDYTGQTWQGRPLSYQGAHAGNGQLNRGNIGIELLGNFERSHPSGAQKRSLELLLRCLMDTYRLKSSKIYTHRELKPTICPGRHGQALVDSLRRTFRQEGR